MQRNETSHAFPSAYLPRPPFDAQILRSQCRVVKDSDDAGLTLMTRPNAFRFLNRSTCKAHIVRAATFAAAFVAAASAAAQPCNPIVDGTYCAEQMPSSRTRSQSSSSGPPPMRSLSSDLSISTDYYDKPATIGAVTFRGNGQRCVGLMFQGRCN